MVKTSDFSIQEARRRLLQGAKLKPVLLGINRRGIMRLCPKTKEVQDFWEYQVLKNWAYSRRTFVVVGVVTGSVTKVHYLIF